MAFTGNEDHSIDFKEAAELTKNYRNQMEPGNRKGGYFSKDAIYSLLEQERCVGIRYYYGLDDDDNQVLVVVGVGANENDLIGDNEYVCIEASVPCPNQCGAANILNS
jgi:hypothetical protein